MTEQYRDVIRGGRQYIELPGELVGVVGNVELGKKDARGRGWDKTRLHIIQEDRTKSRGVDNGFGRERRIALIIRIGLQKCSHDRVRATVDGMREVSTNFGRGVGRCQRSDTG